MPPSPFEGNTCVFAIYLGKKKTMRLDVDCAPSDFGEVSLPDMYNIGFFGADFRGRVAATGQIMANF